MIKKPYDLKNVLFFYIINGKSYKSDPFEIKELLKSHNKEQVLFGPEWCKGVYFYLSKKD